MALGAAVLMTGLAGPAAAHGAGSAPHAAGKIKPTITFILSPRHTIARGEPLGVTVKIGGPRGVAKHTVDIGGVPGGDCYAIDLEGGEAGCENDALEVPVGPHTVSVDFRGDNHYLAATAKTTIQVTKGVTSLDLETSDETPVPSGEKVTLLAEVFDAVGYVPNSGTVRFSDDSATIDGCGAMKLSSADQQDVSCRTILPAGRHTITAAYSGTKQFTASKSRIGFTATSSALQVATASLHDGYTGSAYSSRLAAAGGKGPYTWKISAGGLPTGLTLSGAGVISGTPTATGKWSVTVEVTDAHKTSALRGLTLRISSPVDTALGMTCPGATFATTTDCTLTATNKTSGPAPTGTLQYSFGRSDTNSCTLPAEPKAGATSASCVVQITWDGDGSLSADLSYFGDAAHSASDGSAPITVAAQTGGLDTTGAISCPGAQPFADSTCTITITNSPSSGTPAPTGTADFAYLNDEGEQTGQTCTLSTVSTHASHCTFTYGFEEVPSTVRVNYYGDAKHHATTQDVTLQT